MTKNDSTLTIAIIIVLALFLFGGFGMISGFGFGGMPWMYQMHYGSQTLCSNAGGIWCYWPAYAISSLISILIVIILVVLLIKLVKQQGVKDGKR